MADQEQDPSLNEPPFFKATEEDLRLAYDSMTVLFQPSSDHFSFYDQPQEFNPPPVEATNEFFSQDFTLSPELEEDLFLEEAPVSPTLQAPKLPTTTIESTSSSTPTAPETNNPKTLTARTAAFTPITHSQSTPVIKGSIGTRPAKTTTHANIPATLASTYSSSMTSQSPPGNPNDRPRLSEAQKKENHIRSEQKRREAIREGFDRLASIVPGMEGQGRSEAVVLEATLKHMREQIKKRQEIIADMRARGEDTSHLELDAETVKAYEAQIQRALAEEETQQK